MTTRTYTRFDRFLDFVGGLYCRRKGHRFIKDPNRDRGVLCLRCGRRAGPAPTVEELTEAITGRKFPFAVDAPTRDWKGLYGGQDETHKSEPADDS